MLGVVGVDFAHDGMVCRSTCFCEQFMSTTTKSNVVLNKAERYAEVVFPTGRPTGIWWLDWCAANEMKVIVRSAEDDFSHQRPEAVQPNLCDSVAIAYLGNESRKPVGLGSDDVSAFQSGYRRCKRTSSSPSDKISIVQALEFGIGCWPERILAVAKR